MKPFPTFTEFFRGVWGYDPFPWQVRLADESATGSWPEWITLPTGTGKTTVIDIAVYNLARQADRPTSERTAPVRIVFAVNRRIVVDDAFDRAKRIAQRIIDALHNPVDPLHPLAQSLQRLSGIEGSPPLETYPLRGGTFTDHSWAKTPTQPLVISTTLDQLGSRLLFRGYGVSQFARPIHAALLANDALLILDEAHTAKAFSQTLSAIAKLRLNAHEPLQVPFTSIQLTATPPEEAKDAFSLAPDDRTHPLIKARLAAEKPAELIQVDGAKGSARHKSLAEKMAAKAIHFLEMGNRRVLIVVNRVATAEALKAVLSPTKGNKDHGATVEILTGRLRPLDREGLVRDLDEKFQLKASAPSGDVSSLILIATQCIEVGADFDFDALVTELAPLDNLRQRFGRLNRHGREIPAAAAIFAPDESLDEAKPDPIYGTCLPAVWQWLSLKAGGGGSINFGLEAMNQVLPTGEELTGLLAPAPDAPILLTPYLDLLCQTSPEPQVSPDPALFIHGPGRSFPEVSVVLRADLVDNKDVVETLKAVPPLAGEAATVPLHLAREWLEKPGKAKDDSGDTPEDTEEYRANGKDSIVHAYRWNAGEACALENPNDLRAGDTLVLPAQTDRATLVNLFPAGDCPDAWCMDQYERAHLLTRDTLAIRFHTGVRDALEVQIKDSDARRRFQEITAPLFEKDSEEDGWVFNEKLWLEAIPGLSSLLAKHLPDAHPMRLVWSYAALATGKWKTLPYPVNSFAGVIFSNRARVGATQWPLDSEDLGRQNDASQEPILLFDHSEAVSKRAEENGFGLSNNLRHVLRDAGSWHDLGKLDPRFQALLHGCALWAAYAKDKLAKSGVRSHSLDQHFRQMVGLPNGFRHELLSALVAMQAIDGKDYPENDLLLHLIASHHGRCRSMAPVVTDTQPMPFEADVGDATILFPGQNNPLAHLSQGVASRFWSLTRRFGWWGLPYLESMLRLADQYESANPKTHTSL